MFANIAGMFFPIAGMVLYAGIFVYQAAGQGYGDWKTLAVVFSAGGLVWQMRANSAQLKEMKNAMVTKHDLSSLTKLMQAENDRRYVFRDECERRKHNGGHAHGEDC